MAENTNTLIKKKLRSFSALTSREPLINQTNYLNQTIKKFSHKNKVIKKNLQPFQNLKNVDNTLQYSKLRLKKKRRNSSLDENSIEIFQQENQLQICSNVQLPQAPKKILLTRASRKGFENLTNKTHNNIKNKNIKNNKNENQSNEKLFIKINEKNVKENTQNTNDNSLSLTSSKLNKEDNEKLKELKAEQKKKRELKKRDLYIKDINQQLEKLIELDKQSRSSSNQPLCDSPETIDYSFYNYRNENMSLPPYESSNLNDNNFIYEFSTHNDEKSIFTKASQAWHMKFYDEKLNNLKAHLDMLQKILKKNHDVDQSAIFKSITSTSDLNVHNSNVEMSNLETHIQRLENESNFIRLQQAHIYEQRKHEIELKYKKEYESIINEFKNSKNELKESLANELLLRKTQAKLESEKIMLDLNINTRDSEPNNDTMNTNQNHLLNSHIISSNDAIQGTKFNLIDKLDFKHLNEIVLSSGNLKLINMKTINNDLKKLKKKYYLTPRLRPRLNGKASVIMSSNCSKNESLNTSTKSEKSIVYFSEASNCSPIYSTLNAFASSINNSNSNGTASINNISCNSSVNATSNNNYNHSSSSVIEKRVKLNPIEARLKIKFLLNEDEIIEDLKNLKEKVLN